MHTANNTRLMGQPFRMEYWIGIGPAICTLICTEETALSYMFRMRSTKQSLSP